MRVKILDELVRVKILDELVHVKILDELVRVKILDELVQIKFLDELVQIKILDELAQCTSGVRWLLAPMHTMTCQSYRVSRQWPVYLGHRVCNCISL